MCVCVCVCVCKGCPVYCRLLSSISGLYLVNVLLHTAILPGYDNQNCLMGKITLADNHWAR